jgi:uncharacterized protein (TIGR00725 family)
MLVFDQATGRLFNQARDQCFDPLNRYWTAETLAGGTELSAVAAATWLQRQSGHPLRQPIAVIGPREASAEQLAAAEAIGAALGTIGLFVVCGGRQGIMEAVCRGTSGVGGISIGLLPETEASGANRYVTIPIATGIGEARNALVARAAFCLMAIGDSYGTLSEVALGLQFGRPVIGLYGAARVRGVRQVESVEDAVDRVAALVLGLPAADEGGRCEVAAATKNPQ